MPEVVVAVFGTDEAATADFVCDGIADEVEINAAIQQLADVGGGTVSIAPGTYSISTNIAVVGEDNIHLEGAGAGQTIIEVTPDFYYTEFQAAIGFHDVQGFSVRGITVDASQAVANGIQCNLSSGGVIADCESFIQPGWSYAIWSLHSDNIQILNNHVQGGETYADTSVLQEGIEIYNSDNVIVSGNTVKNIGGAGIFIFSPSDSYEINNIQVLDNIVDYTTRGLWIAHEGPRSLEDVTIQGNTFTNITGYGVHVWNTDYGAFSVPGPEATVDNPQHLRNISIANNSIQLAPAAELVFSTGRAIFLENSADPGEAFFSDIVVTDNLLFESSMEDGSIHVLNVADVQFAGNTVFSTISYQLGTHLQALVLVEGTGAADAVGNDQDNLLRGNSNENALLGGLGNDAMIGGAGRDTMTGGLGNDIYFIDNAGDTANESQDGGYDTVFASVNFTLPDNIEDLVLDGAGDIAGKGNGFTNSIYGNGGNNLLDGRSGADAMLGRDGRDVYIVDDVADRPIEGAGPNAGYDTVFTSVNFTLPDNIEDLVLNGAGDLAGTGNGFTNSIYGNSGNNLLDGRSGADAMLGRDGKDVYIVDNVADRPIEGAGPNAGYDTVFASVNFTLPDNIEDLVLNGAGDLAGTGNGFTNSIYGNSGNNLLDGRSGADAMLGRDGKDIYIVDNVADRPIEAAGPNAGYDTVFASVNFTLLDNVEDLVLTGAGNTNGVGNTSKNSIYGNSGSNVLTGGADGDAFVFRADWGQDYVTDFDVDFDVLVFSQASFASAADVIAHATDDGMGSTVVVLDATHSLALTGVTKADLQAHTEALLFV